MKNKILIPLLIIGGLAAFFSFKYSGKSTRASDDKRILVQEAVMKTIQMGHFSPKNLDDTFSARVFHKFINELDYDKLFFTRQDMDRLDAYQYKIDDEIKANSIEFFDSVDAIFIRRNTAAEKYYQEILSKPFTFTDNEEISLNADKETYAANETQLMDRWRLYLKYRVLVRYEDLKDEQNKKKENKDSVNAVMKTDAELETIAREDTRKLYDRLYKRYHKWKDDDRYTWYINAIAENEDPHTEYFPPLEKKGFDEMMSGSFFGIGAQLKEDNNKIAIIDIIPGSPSWKQGDLKAGDEILKVAQGAKTPVDIQGFEIDDVVKLIRGDKGTEVRLTVKKTDGSTKVIPIIRGIVQRDETFAKSAIIKTNNGPVGYIYLPEFYADFNHTSGRSCATDVAAEVGKLKAEGVTGIILDLRNNGGGSLGDVVDMAGIFIGRGPVVQVKGNHSAPAVLRAQPSEDSALYSGPLAIMVNENSASASEILAAALQDYKRAVIVGSMTYGKGTVQKMVDLDQAIDPMTRLQLQNDSTGSESSIGALKLTMEKFYRVNGGSTQLRGVTPDIAITDKYDSYDDDDLGERSNKAALPWDEIPAASYRQTNSVGNLKQLVAISESRIKSNPTFQLIEENSAYMKKKKDENKVSLNEVKYKKDQEEINATSKKMDELQKKAATLDIVNVKVDVPQANADSIVINKNKDWLKSKSKDIYISETVNIINDMSKGSMNVGMKERKDRKAVTY
jgi:carboxyl-terminal processing protease